jgi:surface antigen
MRRPWFTVEVTDDNGLSDTQAFDLYIAPASTDNGDTRTIEFSNDLEFEKVDWRGKYGPSSRELVQKIKNSGNRPLAVYSITYPNGFSGNWTGGTINPGQSQSVKVTFCPTINADCEYEGYVLVSSDATNANSQGNSEFHVYGKGYDSYKPDMNHIAYKSLQNGGINPLGEENIGQCTAFAWGRANEKMNLNIPYRHNAGGWENPDFTTDDYGVFATGTVPRKNSIAVWVNTTPGIYYAAGHVAFVEDVAGNTVYYNQANYYYPDEVGKGSGYTGHVETKTVDGMKNAGASGHLPLKHYIYLEEPLNGGSGGTETSGGSSDTGGGGGGGAPTPISLVLLSVLTALRVLRMRKK